MLTHPLEKDDSIIAIVYASNELGTGDPSEESDGALLCETVPD